MEIKRMKRRLIANIILTIIFVVWSGIFWGNLDLDQYWEYARKSTNQSYIGFEIDGNDSFTLNNLKNSENRDNDFYLNVYNDTYLNSHYDIALKIDNNVNYNQLYLKVDDSINNFQDLLVKQDDNYNYFIIASNDLSGSERTYGLALYADNNSMDYFVNNGFKIEFVDLSANKVL